MILAVCELYKVASENGFPEIRYMGVERSCRNFFFGLHAFVQSGKTLSIQFCAMFFSICRGTVSLISVKVKKISGR
jgi:hypothetical protein